MHQLHDTHLTFFKVYTACFMNAFYLFDIMSNHRSERSVLLVFYVQIRKPQKSDLDWLIVLKGESDTAGRSSGQNAGGNGRSALSEERNFQQNSKTLMRTFL